MITQEQIGEFVEYLQSEAQNISDYGHALTVNPHDADEAIDVIKKIGVMLDRLNEIIGDSYGY